MPINRPTTIVIFGASGDLTRRKLVPAFYNLFVKERLSKEVRIVGFARRPWDDETFRSLMKDGVTEFSNDSFDAERWRQFAPMLHYFQGNLNRAEDYAQLDAYLDDLEGGPCERLYYLSTAPSFYTPAVAHLGAAGMASEIQAARRIVIEKPFGHDLQSAQDLNRAVHQVFDEKQIFRIDHYLGKETAQNILFFRFFNTIFDPVWNRNYVDNIQITAAESVDVNHRAGYYDQAGVLRDMFQNHMLQLLSLVTMEPPASFDADDIRNEKVKVLQAIRPVNLRETVRGQYDGYAQAEGVAQESQTATFAAIKLHIDNWRWKGVPVYLRSGKALPQKTSEIIIEFQEPPHLMFDLPADYDFTPNILAICIQPDEGIHLKFETKVPDAVGETRSVDMEFHYSSSFEDRALPDAYERLLLDAIHGDASLFTRSDGIEAAWRFIDPLIRGWRTDPDAPTIAAYQPGSWGPDDAHELLARDGRVWRLGCGHEHHE